MPAEEQACVVYAGVRGFLDKVATSDIANFEKKFLDHLRARFQHILRDISEKGEITPAVDDQLKSCLEEFVPSAGLQMKG